MANAKKASSPAYEALIVDLMTEHPDLETGSLFGMPCLKARGKAVLGSFDGGVVFKLGDATVRAEALALAGSVLFDPGGKGRPMKEWVVVGAQHEGLWGSFAAAALGPAGAR